MQNEMLLEEIISSSNLHQAYDQVVGNKGAPVLIMWVTLNLKNSSHVNGVMLNYN